MHSVALSLVGIRMEDLLKAGKLFHNCAACLRVVSWPKLDSDRGASCRNREAVEVELVEQERTGKDRRLMGSSRGRDGPRMALVEGKKPREVSARSGRGDIAPDLMRAVLRSL